MIPRFFELKIWGLKFWRFRGFEHFRLDPGDRERIQFPCANSFEPLSTHVQTHSSHSVSIAQYMRIGNRAH
jgi:hypothetical protein